MSERLKTIYRATNAMQAHLLKQLLAEREIPCRVVGDAILNVESLDSPVSVMVPLDHIELAQFIADSFDRNIVRARAEAVIETDDESRWIQWPKCPMCGTQRMTWCKLLPKRSVTDFELADASGWPGTDTILLLCSICDEPFEPDFFKACAACGRRFEDGIEPQPVSRETESEVFRSSVAAILFIAAFSCVVWWILRS